MPLLPRSSYSPPTFLANGHLQTLLPTLFRRVRDIRYQRERIGTPDGDFLDLDWSRIGVEEVAILSHGLEGSSQSPYMRGMARALNQNGWDVLAWNFRGCSGVPNRTPRFYHSGATEDLETIISHVVSKNVYTEIALIGFSLGGNLTLKYLGERGGEVHSLIRRTVTFSVPCDLAASVAALSKPANQIYMRQFLKKLHQKIKAKMEIMPEKINDDGFERLKTFRDFDDRYTAPLHGFKDAGDYWRKCSCKSFLEDITIPTLIVNAKDDPFLAPSCYPIEQTRDNPHVFLEMPDSGGHAGFITLSHGGQYWSEWRAIAFLNDE